MNNIYIETEKYFEQIWDQGQKQWLSGNVTAAKMMNGSTDPIDYCLSTIARLQEQDVSLIDEIIAVQDQLRKVSPNQFFYPPESLHVSLLGCSPRMLSPEDFCSEKIEKIQKVCASVFHRIAPIRMDLRGLNINGPQVFIQVFPKDRVWAELRQRLEEELLRNGEEPIVYKDKNPIHLNIMRITNVTPECLKSLFILIQNLHWVEFGQLQVTTIDYLLTDFVVSPAHIQLYGKFYLH